MRGAWGTFGPPSASVPVTHWLNSQTNEPQASAQSAFVAQYFTVLATQVRFTLPVKWQTCPHAHICPSQGHVVSVQTEYEG